MDWRDEIRNPDCELCPLHEGAEFRCLMGSGPKDADIMIIGEAPGAREDETHRAFVGPAGKLLTKVLKNAGIDRRECYITNVAKCRPPENRTPERDEIKTCVSNYLIREIEAVDPSYILTVGNTALQGVVGKSGIKKHRGQVFPSDGLDILATYHTAAALRNPRLIKEIESDVQRFGRLVRGEDSELHTSVKMIRSAAQLKWLTGQLLKAEEISFDIETWVDPEVGESGEEWHGEDSHVVCVGFTWQAGLSAVVPLDHKTRIWKDHDEILNYLSVLLTTSHAGVKLIGQNAKYDCRWIDGKTGLQPKLHFDTMLAAHMLDENRSKGLDNLVHLLLGVDQYKGMVDRKNLYHQPLKRVVRYNGLDTDYTFQIYHKLRDELKKEPRLARVFTKLMMPASNALVEIERRGIYVDRRRWREVYKKTAKNEELLRRYIHQYTDKKKQYGPTRGKNKTELGQVNLNAPMQVGEFLFGDLGLPILELTKKEKPSTKESVLLQLRTKHPVVKAMLKWRKWNKYLTTYVRPFGLHLDKNGRYHPTYRPFGTVTGRLSAEGSIQQVPRDTFIRGLFGAPPGRVLIQGDYSQVELRIAAMLANERRMIRQFLAGEDIHMIRACRMTGKSPEDVTKEERKKAKAVNFGFLYRMGWEKFIIYARDNYEVDVSDAEAQRARDGFFEDYPGLVQWHNRQVRLVHRYKRVHSPLGRVRHLPDIDSQDKSVRAEAERQAINSPVQSFASDLMLLSLIQLVEKGVDVVGTIHDELLFECDEDKVDETVPLIRDVMTDMSVVKRKFGTQVTVPIEVEIKVGKHWGEGEPYVFADSR